MPSISRARALAYAAAVLALLVVGGRLLLGGSEAERAAAPASAAVVEAERATPRALVVHVVGAVRRPGLYELREGSRVDDAIGKAGGPAAKAALELVNLAAPVADGQQVVVPARTSSGLTGPTAARGEEAFPAAIHLNSATLEELDSLPGVGPVTAQKILDYREAHGAFQSVQELDAVSGIGPTRLAELEELVQL